MFPILFGSIFGLVGLFGMWLAARAWKKDSAIARWPRAPGRIEVAIVTSWQSQSRDDAGHTYETTMYQPQVRYTYTVEDRTLKGDRFARVVVSSSSKPNLTRYSAGSEVQVYYDPADPSIAYLEVHRSIGAIILFCFGGLFLGIGVLVPTLVLLAG